MARRSLKPQLNQIRSWVQQGRTDAWIAHQLDVSVSELVGFKREHELAPPEAEGESDNGPGAAVDQEDDLRAQDEALIAAALDAEPDEADDKDGDDGDGDDGDSEDRPRRRRGRRGGRSRRGRRRPLEGTFDHGDEGYGLWLDPSVQDDPIYAEHWAGHRPVTITVERDQIVIRRGGEDAESEGSDSEDSTDPGASGDAGSSGSDDAGGALDPDDFA